MKKKKAKLPAAPSATSLAASAMAKARWAKMTPEARSSYNAKIGKMGGRPRAPAAKRCFCGGNTMRRALSRHFACCREAGVLIVKQASGG